jgi:hypothetical protein
VESNVGHGYSILLQKVLTMVLRNCVLAALVASTSAFAPAQVVRHVRVENVGGSTEEFQCCLGCVFGRIYVEQDIWHLVRRKRDEGIGIVLLLPVKSLANTFSFSSVSSGCCFLER